MYDEEMKLLEMLEKAVNGYRKCMEMKKYYAEENIKLERENDELKERLGEAE